MPSQNAEHPDQNSWQRPYEVTVDHGPRIRLPRPMVKTLRSDGVKEIILFPDPYEKRLILCPDKYCNSYVKMIMGDIDISIKPDKQ